MSYEITYENAGELFDVVEVLFGSLGSVTEDGVKIDKRPDLRWDFLIDYSLADAEDGPFRTLTAEDYVTEFYKVCGGELTFENYDDTETFVVQCRYIARWLQEPMIHNGMVTLEDFRILQTSPLRRSTVSLRDIGRTGGCMEDEARRMF